MAITKQLDTIIIPSDFFCTISANVQKPSEIMTADPEYYPLKVSMRVFASSDTLGGALPVENAIFIGSAKVGKHTSKDVYKELKKLDGKILSDLFSDLFKAIEEEAQVKDAG
jgi:hypothetical protein